MSDQTDLDIRIVALAAEYAQHVAQLSGRAALLASELASAQAKLKAAEAKVAELTPKEPEKVDGERASN